VREMIPMEQKNNPVSGQDSRRDFIKKTATAAAAVAATNLLKPSIYPNSSPFRQCDRIE